MGRFQLQCIEVYFVVEPMNEEISTIPLPPIHTPKPIGDVKQRQLNAFAILKFLCENSFVSGYLQELLSEKSVIR